MRIIKNANLLPKKQSELREFILTNFNQLTYDSSSRYKEVYRNSYTTCGFD